VQVLLSALEGACRGWAGWYRGWKLNVKSVIYLVLLWLVAVVGRCTVGCEHCECYCSTSRDMQKDGGGGLIAIWSRGLGSPGFCSEKSLPDL